MARKKSVRGAAKRFVTRADELIVYIDDVRNADLTASQETIACGAALTKLVAAFERLILDTLTGAINNDTGTLSETTGIPFPKHLTDEVCEYLITGGRYLDFKGRDGLITTMRRFIPKDHYLIKITKKPAYEEALTLLFALRNFEAHESRTAKVSAEEATGQGMGSGGSWIKVHDRFSDITRPLMALANEIHSEAPF